MASLHGTSLSLALFSALLLGSLVHCQQVSPLQGRGFPPVNGTEVYVSVIIDRLLSVDDIDYRFQAMLYFELSWRDPRAREARQNASDRADASYASGGGGCGFPCSSLFAWTPGSFCCDDIFLPGIEFVNAFGFSQDRPQRYRVVLPDEGDAVVWWAYILGEWYTPLTFQAFPFDNQYLLVQCQYANRDTSKPVSFVPSATSTELNRPRTGDDFSGWQIKGIGVYPFNYTASVEKLIRESGASESNPGDPWPLNPANKSVQAFNSILWSEGFVVAITVTRISLYYVIVAILPIAVNVWLALLIFFVSPKHLDTRIGCVITMFLALTAIQFVIASQLPSSSTVVPTQQLVIVSYVVLALIGIFSILVYLIATADKQKLKREQGKLASNRFERRWKSNFAGGLGAAMASGMAAMWSRFRIFGWKRREAVVGSGQDASQAEQGPAAAAAVPAALAPASPAGTAGAEAGGFPQAPSSAQQQSQEAEKDASFSGGSSRRGSEKGGVGGACSSSREGSRTGSDWQKGPGKDSVHFAGVGVHIGGSDSGSSADGADSDASSSGSEDIRRGQSARAISMQRPASIVGAAATVGSGSSGGLWQRNGVGNVSKLSGATGLAGGLAVSPGSRAAARPGIRGPTADGIDVEIGGQQQQGMQQQGGSGSGGGGMEGTSSRGGRWWRRGCGGSGSCGWLSHWKWVKCLWEGPAGWFELQILRYKEMVREAQEDREYANFLANRIDRFVFWFVLVSYNVSIVLIFAIGSTQQPQLPYVDGAS